MSATPPLRESTDAVSPMTVTTDTRPVPTDAEGRSFLEIDGAGGGRLVRPLIHLLAIPVAVGFVGIIAGAVVTGTAALLGRSTDGGPAVPGPGWELVLTFAPAALLLPVCWLVVRAVGWRSLGTVSSVVGRLRWRWLLTCLPPAIVLLGAQVLVELIRSGWSFEASLWPGWGSYALVVAVVVVLVPLQCAGEEYLFRGLLPQVLVRWTRWRWPAALLASAIFVAGHGIADPWMVADVAVFALSLCWLAHRTGGLEAGIAFHTVNNGVWALAESTQGVSDVGGPLPLLGATDVLPSIVATALFTWWITRRFDRADDALVELPVTDEAQVAPAGPAPEPVALT